MRSRDRGGCYTRGVPDVSPFEGLVFNAAVAGPLDLVTAPPYDTISEARLREHLAASPYNIVRLDLAEGSDEPLDPDNRYERARRLLADWESRGVLVRRPSPSYHAYQMSFMVDGLRRTLTGLMVAMALEDWGGQVIPHERTMSGPLEDRLRLLRATRTHLSAVYGTIEGPCHPLADVLRATTAEPALWEAVDGQGVVHRMWPVDPDPRIATWLAREPLLIADGHHRYTTALEYRKERDAEQGPGAWDRVLTLVVDAATEHPPVLPFHRIQATGAVPPMNGAVADLEAAVASLSDDRNVIARIDREGDEIRYRVLSLPGAPPAVRALHEAILDGRVPEGSIRFVSDVGMADDAVRAGDAVAAYLLPPTTPERIRAVIERGDRLPQKSTFFWPKPRTGMIMLPIDGRGSGSGSA
jgi:uncharacterized protein (DUF1015 family)